MDYINLTKLIINTDNLLILEELKLLTKCFHLFNHESYEPKGLDSDNILRFVS